MTQSKRPRVASQPHRQLGRLRALHAHPFALHDRAAARAAADQQARDSGEPNISSSRGRATGKRCTTTPLITERPGLELVRPVDVRRGTGGERPRRRARARPCARPSRGSVARRRRRSSRRSAGRRTGSASHDRLQKRVDELALGRAADRSSASAAARRSTRSRCRASSSTARPRTPPP